MEENANVGSEKASMENFDMWLINLLYQEGRLTLNEIRKRWKADSLNNSNLNRDLPDRTFHNHKRSIKKAFGLVIKCNLSDNTYYIDKSENTSATLNQIRFIAKMASDATIHAFSVDLEDRILFEVEPFVDETLFRRIVDAMKQKVYIKFDYQKYGQQSVSTRVVAPYCLKMFRGRWYLLAASGKGVCKIYALDGRAQNVELTSNPYTLPKDFSSFDYFKDAFGVITSGRPTKIRIKTFGKETDYWLSVPLHHSQRKVDEGEGFAIFELFLYPEAFEFKQELFSRINQIEVLEPQSLRNEMKELAQRILENYA